MSSLEDEIRDTLHAEAAGLREVRPLHLSAAVASREPQAVPRTDRARRLRAWLVPAVAAAAVVLVAAALVTLRSLGNGGAAAPAASPSPIVGPAHAADATPRYYVMLSTAGRGAKSSWAIIVGDEQTRKTIGTYLLPPGQEMTNAAVSGAADDRTFVVSASTFGAKPGTQTGAHREPVQEPATWYLVRIFPGSADPVRVTRLHIPSLPAETDVRETALSGDGTELAVLSTEIGASVTAGTPATLQVYSVPTGRLQHSWPAGIDETEANRSPISDLSWVGDSTVGFAVTYTPEVREEVRTLDVSASGASLLADSRVVWSQDVPAASLTPREKATILSLEPTTHACDTPFLTPNGQAVVCGNSTYSASDKRLSAVWLSYPLATPTRPRVLASVREPQNVSALDGPNSVEWTNASGTEIIAAWNTTVITGPSNNPVSTTTNDEAYVGNGTVKMFPYILGSGGGSDLAW
jgi:hypothetical protein